MGYGEDLPYGEGNYKGEVDHGPVVPVGPPPSDGAGGGANFGEGAVTTEGEQIFGGNKLNGITGRCLRFAVNPDQGAGWSLYSNGDYMVWPSSGTKPIPVINSTGQIIFLAIDELDKKIYEIQTRNGPVDSGVERTWKDKDGDYAGHEIPCTIRLPEVRGSEEHTEVEHQESHFSFRPYDEVFKNLSDYTSAGYLPAFKPTFRIFKNGEIYQESAEAKDAPIIGDIVYNRKVQDYRLQTEITTTASAFRLVKTNEYYIMKDKRGSPEERRMKEQDWQEELSEPILWLARNKDMLRNLADGTLMTGSISTSVEGPDTLSDSSASFSLTTGLSTTLTGLQIQFTIIFSVAHLVGDTTIFSFNGGLIIVDLIKDSGKWWVRFIDNGFIYRAQLSWKTGWTTIKITRDMVNVAISENGYRLNLIPSYSFGDLSGNLLIMDGVIGHLYPVYILDSAVSDEAFLYYCKDLLEYKGKATLPLW